MASMAEQLAANINVSAFSKATELKKRIWFTLGALIIYRLGTYIPVPGVDATVMAQLLAKHQGGILGMFDMFSGGALGRMTIFALNIMPYISASIIIQLMSSAMPSLEALKKEGEQGRKKLNQYTRYLTVFIALFQAYGIAIGLESMKSPAGSAVTNPGMLFLLTCFITLVGGTMFLMWLGEQITARGVGNGISLIIFAGIVANLPTALASLFQLGYTGALSPFFVVAFLVLAAVTIAFIVFMEQAQRRVVIQYPKRQVGQRMYGGDSTHMLFYAAMIIFFSYFYAAVSFNPKETADNLRKQGGFITGSRPGVNTATYFDNILTRLTTIGALYLVVVCLLPQFLINHYNVPFYFGGTSLIIIVSVTIDTVTQVQSHLVAHQYQGLLRKSRFGKGKKR